jgi:MoaA/NifB/PqqE/SkfB family radical SAM enzyme
MAYFMLFNSDEREKARLSKISAMISNSRGDIAVPRPKFLNRLFQNSYPFLDWVQVEISSYCNGKCVYCPHTEYQKNWQSRYLPMELFRNLLPAFAKTNLVHLQGWGEPFTHPDFFDMLRTAKKAGCMVGTTTNGSLLSREKIEALVKEDLDLIGFSLAGIDEKNDSIRRGTSIGRVLDCIDEIHKAKAKYRTDKPKIHLAYMLMRSGVDDLDKLPDFLANAGVTQAVISSLSLVVNPEIEAESIISLSKPEFLELKDRLIQVRADSENLGTEVHFQIVSPFMERFHCMENAARAVVIGSNGGVSPCVMAQIPVEGRNDFYFRKRKQPLQKMSFGSIVDDSLNKIWHQKEYRQFLMTYRRGKTPAFCVNCLKGFSDDFTQETSLEQVQAYLRDIS